MRFRVTLRGDNTELRGRIDVGSTFTLNEFAEAVKPFGMVIASATADDWDPFAISEPEFPPTADGSRDVITSMMEDTDGAGFIDRLVQLHLAQANVIRGERYLREHAEAELRDRELHHFEVEQMSEKYLNGLRQAEALNRELVARVADLEAQR